MLFLLIAEALLLLVSIKQVKTRLLPILHRLTRTQNIEDLRELFEHYPDTFLQWELAKTSETVIEIRRARDAALIGSPLHGCQLWHCLRFRSDGVLMKPSCEMGEQEDQHAERTDSGIHDALDSTSSGRLLRDES